MTGSKHIHGNHLWIFLILFVLPAPGFGQVEYFITVAQDGSGDYTTIQSAIDATKAFPDQRITIFIRNGIYMEKVHVFSWNNLLTLRGESREGTVIRFDDHFKRIARGRNSTFHTPTLLVEANDFIAENLTIENTAGPVGQAIALSVVADRAVFRNCSIRGHQDTLYVAGAGRRQYFLDCLIEGTTDFIFGEATAVFHQCEIRALSDSYITAASTPQGAAYGLVFIECDLTGGEKAEKVYLGRPWRPYARTVFLDCRMEDIIRPEGWHDWSKPEVRNTVFYAEYNGSGPGYQPENRVGWAHILDSARAKEYTLRNILSAEEGVENQWYTLNSGRNDSK